MDIMLLSSQKLAWSQLPAVVPASRCPKQGRLPSVTSRFQGFQAVPVASIIKVDLGSTILGTFLCALFHSCHETLGRWEGPQQAARSGLYAHMSFFRESPCCAMYAV